MSERSPQEAIQRADDLRVVFVLASALVLIVLAGYTAGAIATGALGMFAGIVLLVATGVAFSICSVVVG